MIVAIVGVDRGDPAGHQPERRPRRAVPGRDAAIGGRRYLLLAAEFVGLGAGPHLRRRDRGPAAVRADAHQGADRAGHARQPAAGDRGRDRHRRPGRAGDPAAGRVRRQEDRAERRRRRRRSARRCSAATSCRSRSSRCCCWPRWSAPSCWRARRRPSDPSMFPLVFAGLLFSAGVYGVLARRNAVLVLMSIELMLNAVNVNLVAFSQYLKDSCDRADLRAVRDHGRRRRDRHRPGDRDPHLPQPRDDRRRQGRPAEMVSAVDGRRDGVRP